MQVRIQVVNHEGTHGTVFLSRVPIKDELINWNGRLYEVRSVTHLVDSEWHASLRIVDITGLSR
jgi:hypothetical protein